MTGPGAGSQGTETNAFQFLKGSTIIIKNGKITAEAPLKMGIQNYANLTLDNVDVSGDDSIQYTVSNNYGNVIFKNGTTITPTGNNVAFDVWYGMQAVYDEPGVFVTIADDSVKINGRVEFGKHSRASKQKFATNASLTCPSDMELNVDILTQPCQWTDNGDGSKTLRYVLEN